MIAFRKTQLCIFADKIPKAIHGNAAQLKKHHHADHQCQRQIKEKTSPEEICAKVLMWAKMGKIKEGRNSGSPHHLSRIFI